VEAAAAGEEEEKEEEEEEEEEEALRRTKRKRVQADLRTKAVGMWRPERQGRRARVGRVRRREAKESHGGGVRKGGGCLLADSWSCVCGCRCLEGPWPRGIP